MDGAPLSTWDGGTRDVSCGRLLYTKHTVSIPSNTTFAIQLRVAPHEPFVGDGEAIRLRFDLIGYYRNVVEIG